MKIPVLAPNVIPLGLTGELVTVKVSGAVPPVVVRVSVLATPAVVVTEVPLVFVKRNCGFTLMVSDWLAETPSVSVAVTVS